MCHSREGGNLESFVECLDSRLRGNDGQWDTPIPPGITQRHFERFHFIRSVLLANGLHTPYVVGQFSQEDTSGTTNYRRSENGRQARSQTPDQPATEVA